MKQEVEEQNVIFIEKYRKLHVDQKCEIVITTGSYILV